MKTQILAAMLAVVLSAHSAVRAGAEVGSAVEVGPKVEGTRCQMWPRVAWSEGAKCWLVAWREGWPNQNEADIVCARVSADGQALDPAGIRVCKAKGNQEWPTVASDGKGFLVAWEDFRNGKDWDVYAARVSGDGKLLDPDGFLVAGGKGHQGRPCAVYAGGNYLLVWQGYLEQEVSDKNGYPVSGAYNLFAARVSVEGRVLDANPEPIVRDNKWNMIDPAVSVAGKTVVVACKKGMGTNRTDTHCMEVMRVDPATGKLIGPLNISTLLDFKGKLSGGRDGARINLDMRMPGLLMVDDESGLLASKLDGRISGNLICLRKCGSKFGGDSVNLGIASAGGLALLPSISWDGTQALVLMDWNCCPEGSKMNMNVEVHGWMISGDGKVLDDPKTGFVIAANGPQKVEMQGFGAAGAKGTFLVAYVELRALADTKVMARLVKIK